MKQIISKKTGKVSIISDEDYEKILSLGIKNRFEVKEVRPIKAIIPNMPIITKVEKVEKKATKQKTK
jgi:hypothetical protein